MGMCLNVTTLNCNQMNVEVFEPILGFGIKLAACSGPRTRLGQKYEFDGVSLITMQDAVFHSEDPPCPHTMCGKTFLKFFLPSLSLLIIFIIRLGIF